MAPGAALRGRDVSAPLLEIRERLDEVLAAVGGLSPPRVHAYGGGPIAERPGLRAWTPRARGPSRRQWP